MEDAKEAIEGEEGETFKKKKKHASPRSLRIKNHRSSKGLKDVYHNSSSNLYNTLKSIPRHSPLAHKERTLSLSIGDLEETDEERERKKERKESSSQIVTAKERKSGKEKRRGNPGILSTSDPSSSAESLSAWMSSDSSSSDDSNSDSDYELDPSWVKDEFEEEDRRLWMETHGRKREEDSLIRSRSLSPPAREPQASPHTQDKLFSSYQNLNKGGIIEDLLARAKKPSASGSGTNSGKEGKEEEGDGKRKSNKDQNPIIEVTQASSEGQVLLYSRSDSHVHKEKKKKSIDEMIKATRARSTSVPPPTLKRRATIANFPTKLSVPSPKKSTTSSQGSVGEEEDDKENDREFRSSSPAPQKTQERRQKRRSADSGGLRSLSARSLRKNVHAGEKEGQQEREKKKRNGIFRTRSLSLRRWQIMGKEKKAKDAEEKQRGRRGRSWTLGSRGSTSLSPRDRKELRANSKSPTKGEK